MSMSEMEVEISYPACRNYRHLPLCYAPKSSVGMPIGRVNERACSARILWANASPGQLSRKWQSSTAAGDQHTQGAVDADCTNALAGTPCITRFPALFLSQKIRIKNRTS